MTKVDNAVRFTAQLIARGADVNRVPLTANRLMSIARSLHRKDENDCSYEYPSEEAEKRADRREERLEKEATSLAKELNAVGAYHQTDPRGWSLYVIFKGDVPDGKPVDSYYTAGVAVPS